MKYEADNSTNIIYNDFSTALSGGAYCNSNMVISCTSSIPMQMPYRYEITGDDIGASWTPRSARQAWVGRCLYCGVKRRDDERYCVACGAPS